MDKILIDGGIPLKGTLRVSGSKNAALPCLFATLLTDEECILDNVPDLVDITTTCSLLEHLGKSIVRSKNTVTIRKGKNLKAEASYDLVRRMRASALVLGPLLARLGKASAAMPGGCAIGVRPIDIHLSAFRKLGAKTSLSKGMVQLYAPKLVGSVVKFVFPSVGATENVLMASVLSKGKTFIHNAACEPEIEDLANLLNEMGAKIHGAGTPKITIEGIKNLNGVKHTVIPDRIEASTYLIAAAATKGKVVLTHVNAQHIDCVLRSIQRAGIEITIKPQSDGSDTVISEYVGPFKPVNIKTEVYPKFPTDVQAQWMTLMSLAKGKSLIEETIFENRFLHAAELNRMGAEITIRGNKASVSGVSQLLGADVMVSDLRAGAAMVIAGLAAKGKTAIHRIYHLDRGYERLEDKLKSLGAKIRRVPE